MVLNIIGVVLISSACSKLDKKHTAVVLGHAGGGISEGRYVYPPNSYESIAYALDVLDADGVEVDIRLTLDTAFVLFHDSRLEELTDGEGCIESLTFEEVDALAYKKKYFILPLEEVLEMVADRNKLLYLDLKPLPECEGVPKMNAEQMNKGLEVVEQFDGEEPLQRITVNTVDLNLLTSIENPWFIRSWETTDVDEAINQFQLGEIDKLTINVDALDEDKASSLLDAGLPFTIFNVKTQKEIRTAYGLLPTEIISDNIAFTKKLMN